MENYKPTRALLGRDAPLSDGGFSDAGRSDESGTYSLLNIKRYRRYFNVDTEVGCSGLRWLLASYLAGNRALGRFTRICFLVEVVPPVSCQQRHKAALHSKPDAIMLLLQDVLSRITDSVVGFWRADFMEKTTDNADL